MPELPDIEDYRAALTRRMVGATLLGTRLRSFALLRTYDPPLEAVGGRRCAGIERLGKRLVFRFPPPKASDARDERPETLYLVVHLMVSGRLAWAAPGAAIPGKVGSAAFDLSAVDDPDTPGGTLVLREAGTKKRASLHVVAGRDGLAAHDRGGIEPLDADLVAFVEALTAENRTLKRALTDPRRFSGIGNAYSDEILHAAGLSPVRRSRQLDQYELARLHDATRSVLAAWTERLRAETGDGFPTRVTAFRDDFAVHGRFEQPCPACATPVQRIRYADNETNYCPRCQTEDRVLADRSLSRLLKDDWPATVDELEGA